MPWGLAVNNSVNCCLAFIAITLALVLPASAESRSADVRAGAKTLIYRFTIYDRVTCQAMGYPKLESRSSKNGQFSSSRGSFVAQDGKCKGKRFNATDVYYRPNSGFRGKDRGKVVLRYSRGDEYELSDRFHTVNFTLNVK